jgi:hypothetical protein
MQKERGQCSGVNMFWRTCPVDLRHLPPSEKATFSSSPIGKDDSDFQAEKVAFSEGGK